MPSSLRVWIHRTWVVFSARMRYFTFVVDLTTKLCLLDHPEMRFYLKKYDSTRGWHLIIKLVAQSRLQKTCKGKGEAEVIGVRWRTWRRIPLRYQTVTGLITGGKFYENQTRLVMKTFSNKMSFILV